MPVLLKPFFSFSSIKSTLRVSYTLIIVVLLIPVVLSITVMFINTVSYDRLISNVDKTNQLNQTVKTDITNELWDIVAGNKPFVEGRQFIIISEINRRIADIKKTTTSENQQMLEVAGRAMNTLVSYVNRLGIQMRESSPVIENEKMLDEIRSVAALVSEILQDFIVSEIESTARANEEMKSRAFTLGVAELIVVLFVTLFSIIARRSVTASIDKSIGDLAELSTRIASGDLDARAEAPHVEELDALTENLNVMAGKIKDLIDTNIREQRNLQKSEMKALQAQITPHFLYNTLDSIIWLAEGKQYEEVVTITRAFSNFFRISLNRGREWITVKEEFDHAENYLTIQKIRYRDILDYSINYEEGMKDKTILKLILQPLVENALYHGIKNKRGKGVIAVKGWVEDGWLCFSVEDNGIGIKEDDLINIKEQVNAREENTATVYGLYNVSRRLELYYGKSGLLDIESVYRKGTSVTLRVPATPPAAEGGNV